MPSFEGLARSLVSNFSFDMIECLVIGKWVLILQEGAAKFPTDPLFPYFLLLSLFGGGE